MNCPNCGRCPEKAAHGDGCLLGALVNVLKDRGHDLSSVDLTKVDADALWEMYGDPAAGWVAEQLGLPAYPPEEGGAAGTG
jgi:hypothetical protein